MWMATAENAQSFKCPLNVCKKERKLGVYAYVGAEVLPTTGGMALSVGKPAECSNTMQRGKYKRRKERGAAAPAEGGHSCKLPQLGNVTIAIESKRRLHRLHHVYSPRGSPTATTTGGPRNLNKL